MSELYEKIHDQIEEFRAAGFEPDKVVVHGKHWDEIKEECIVVEDSDAFMGEKTLLNGLRVTWNKPMSDARIVFETEMDDDE